VLTFTFNENDRSGNRRPVVSRFSSSRNHGHRVPELRSFRSIRIFSLSCFGVAWLSACYTQRSLTTPVPVAGTRIVAELTDTGTVAMATKIGPGATEVEGVIADADGANWRVLLLRVDQRGVGPTLWNRESVTFPRLALTRVTERTLDKRRSWLMAAFIAGAAFTAARAFGAFSFLDEGGTQTDVTK
jgi:hypothetical protein